jgi:hypothetical protein
MGLVISFSYFKWWRGVGNLAEDEGKVFDTRKRHSDGVDRVRRSKNVRQSKSESRYPETDELGR